MTIIYEYGALSDARFARAGAPLLLLLLLLVVVVVVIVVVVVVVIVVVMVTGLIGVQFGL